jgi:hypothetical protein
MTRRAVEASPQTYARIGGILYLFIIVAALFGEAFVRGSFIAQGDADATARNILAVPRGAGPVSRPDPVHVCRALGGTTEQKADAWVSLRSGENLFLNA